MGSNHFGKIFSFTTWGESHGKAIGVVIDGCPSGIEITEEVINQELYFRSPGRSEYVSPRKEEDKAEILSGVFQGKTTGAPISILLKNRDYDSSVYEKNKELFRPGHAEYSYYKKYGIFDHRGGSRASARETAARVAAGAVAKQFLKFYGIEIVAYLKEMGEVISNPCYPVKKKEVVTSPIFCPDVEASKKMCEELIRVKKEGDSLGGVVEFFIENLPEGLGDPVYEKLEANLAKAMMGLPASKGFSIGEGFSSAKMKGSEHNDLFILDKGKEKTITNHSGGILGGISTGMPLWGKVAFKPASSIRKEQKTLNQMGEEKTFILPEGSRHDVCVAIRAVAVVEAMCALVLADALLLQRCVKVSKEDFSSIPTPHIEKGLLFSQKLLTSCRKWAKSWAVITEDNVASLYGEKLLEFLKSNGIEAKIFSFPPGEKSKSRATKETIEDEMVQKGIGREGGVIALGGGVVTDIAGFIAASYCRGIPFLSLPTTLLAMVDASIGGKVGINTPLSKNRIGAFYHPKEIFIDLNLLLTLPEREKKCGEIEMSKQGLIGDKTLFEEIANREKDVTFSELIEKSIQSKLFFVREDERETKGIREYLNFGHTIGHALEVLTNYTLSHGEAVAWGIAVESLISHKMGLLCREEMEKIHSYLKNWGLAEVFVEKEKWRKVLLLDKKNREGKVRFVLLEKIGKVHSCESVCEEVVEQCLEEMFYVNSSHFRA